SADCRLPDMFEALSHHRDPIEAKLQAKPSPGLRPPSPGGRGTKSLLPPGEGAAQRRMRGVSASATTTPHPAFGSADAKLALTAKLADNASSRFCFCYRRAASLEERRLPPSEYRPFCRNPIPMPVPSVTKPDHPKRPLKPCQKQLRISLVQGSLRACQSFR